MIGRSAIDKIGGTPREAHAESVRREQEARECR
jgi:hypothetical protein